MGDAEQGALIGELVIGGVLRNGWLQENDRPEDDRQVGEQPEAVIAFHHISVLCIKSLNGPCESYILNAKEA